jgi:hypothetical protein
VDTVGIPIEIPAQDIQANFVSDLLASIGQGLLGRYPLRTGRELEVQHVRRTAFLLQDVNLRDGQCQFVSARLSPVKFPRADC